jgi:hypothetical protein
MASMTRIMARHLLYERGGKTMIDQSLETLKCCEGSMPYSRVSWGDQSPLNALGLVAVVDDQDYPMLAP